MQTSQTKLKQTRKTEAPRTGFLGVYLVKAYFLIEARNDREAELKAKEILGHYEVLEERIDWIQGPYREPEQAWEDLEEE